MSDLKFSCPACGQRIECSKAYCDQAIQCPSCRTEIRVPCAHSEVSQLKTQSSIPASSQGASPATNGIDKRTTPAADEKELHCRCPVCQSHLRISTLSAAQSAADVFPEAELIIQTPPNGKDPVKPATVAEAPAPTLPTTEREKHIAAERAARDVTLYPKMKPRLDLLMGDGKAKKPSGEDSPDWMKEAA